MRRAAVAVLLGALTLAPAPLARAAGWRSEQPVAAGIGVSVPLGEVGDVSCREANRCLLSTAGNDAIPAGLYAYDGTGWYQLSTVCGGHGGRIAWAGPDDFWTIADQPAGQEATGPAFTKWHLSLCHFKDGAVVASYAEPIGVPTSYEQMDAAACDGPEDCWFAGERLPGTTNQGAFHLHWDGATLSAVPSLTTPEASLSDPPRAVGSLAFAAGHLFESVQVAADDPPNGESTSHPFVLHEIVAGSANPFVAVLTDPLDYGAGAAKVEPWALAALRLSADGEGLWAAAGSLAAEPAAPVNVLRLQGGLFHRIVLNDPEGTLSPGTQLRALAAEPGGESAWAAFSHEGEGAKPPARLARIRAGGEVEAPLELPTPEEGLSHKGSAGPLACPEAGQCWMATSQGWLFHLGPDVAPNTDPAFHSLITFRPPDDSVPFAPPDTLPEDDSGAEPPQAEPPPAVGEEPFPRRRRARPIVTRVRQKMLHGTVLELSFTLHARAHVRLIAKRRKKVVGKTPRLTFAPGRHSIRLRLDPKRWPTGLKFQVHAVEKGKKK